MRSILHRVGTNSRDGRPVFGRNLDRRRSRGAVSSLGGPSGAPSGLPSAPPTRRRRRRGGPVDPPRCASTSRARLLGSRLLSGAHSWPVSLVPLPVRSAACPSLAPGPSRAAPSCSPPIPPLLAPAEPLETKPVVPLLVRLLLRVPLTPPPDSLRAGRDQLAGVGLTGPGPPRMALVQGTSLRKHVWHESEVLGARNGQTRPLTLLRTPCLEGFRHLRTARATTKHKCRISRCPKL